MNLDAFISRDWDILTSNTHIQGFSSDMEGGINSTLGPFTTVPTAGDSGGVIKKPRIGKPKPKIMRGTLTTPISRIFEAKIEGEFTTPWSTSTILEGTIRNKAIKLLLDIMEGNVKNKAIKLPLNMIEGDVKNEAIKLLLDIVEGTTKVPLGVLDVKEGVIKEPEPTLELVIAKKRMIAQWKELQNLLEKKHQDYQESVMLEAERRKRIKEARARKLKQERKVEAERKAKKEKEAKKRKALKKLKKSLDDID